MGNSLRTSEDERHAGRYYGKFRAFVRDNNDPERLGRCRLEIPQVLGEGVDNWSEWASPCFPYGGNPDMGMFLMPDEGASVWAEFEAGDVRAPIWSGVWIAGTNPGEQPLEATRLCSTTTCADCEDRLLHATNRADNAEHAKFHAHPDYYCPRRRVLFKSETGHTIVADDRDGQEFFRVIDRAGQLLEMLAPVDPQRQIGNTNPRGERTATRGDQLPLTDLFGGKASVELMDLARQSVRLETDGSSHRVHLLSCDPQRSRWQKIILDTTPGREQIRIIGVNGSQEILLDGAKKRITLRDGSGNTVTMGSGGITLTDNSGGTVTMGGGSIRVKGTQVRIN